MSNEWRPPSPADNPTSAVPSPPTPRRRRRLLLGVTAGVVALLAVGGVVWLVGSGDDTSGSPADNGGSTRPTGSSAPAVSTSSVLASSLPSTTSAPASSLVLPTFRPHDASPLTPEQLVAAMPTDEQLPPDWQRYTEPVTDPERSTTDGYCGGPNAFARADTIGATVVIEGPTWDLPTGAWVGFQLYGFSTVAEARTFVETTRDQANSCAATAWSYTATEAELDLLPEGFGDTATWSVLEASAASTGQFTPLQGSDRATLEWSYATTVAGAPVTARETELVRYEQRGSLVLEVWVDGVWGYTGTPTSPGWVFRPDQAALDAAYEVLSHVLSTNLSPAGDLDL